MLIETQRWHDQCNSLSCTTIRRKVFKAYLTSKQITFPKTHDLQRLLELAGTTNKQLADELGDVIILTPFGVEIRYPGDRPDATQEEAEMAVTLLSRVRDAVLEALRH